MKKVLILLLFIFSLQITFAQTWCAPGAKWTYSYANYGENGYVELNYTQDTLINSINCKRLFVTRYVKYYNSPDTVIYHGTEITYEQNGVVYIRTSTNYDTLYNFNALIGDHWDMVRFNNHTSKITVLDTGTVTINSIPLKFLAVNLHYNDINFSFDYQDTIIERIGFKASYYIASDRYYAGLDGNVGGELRCYNDDDLNTYKPYYTHACDYIFVGIKELKKEESITIYPNPASSFISITTNNLFGNIKIVELYNAFGQLISESEQTNIDIKELPTGLYFIKVMNCEGSMTIAKFLKT